MHLITDADGCKYMVVVMKYGYMPDVHFFETLQEASDFADLEDNDHLEDKTAIYVAKILKMNG